MNLLLMITIPILIIFIGNDLIKWKTEYQNLNIGEYLKMPKTINKYKILFIIYFSLIAVNIIITLSRFITNLKQTFKNYTKATNIIDISIYTGIIIICILAIIIIFQKIKNNKNK